MAFGARPSATRLYDVARREALVALFECPEEAKLPKAAVIELMTAAFRRGVTWQVEQTAGEPMDDSMHGLQAADLPAPGA